MHRHKRCDRIVDVLRGRKRHPRLTKILTAMMAAWRLQQLSSTKNPDSRRNTHCSPPWTLAPSNVALKATVRPYRGAASIIRRPPVSTKVPLSLADLRATPRLPRPHLLVSTRQQWVVWCVSTATRTRHLPFRHGFVIDW